MRGHLPKMDFPPRPLWKDLAVMLRIAPVLCLSLLFCLAGSHPAMAQPSVRQALSLVPMQADVQFDRPEDDTIPKCTIDAVREGGQRAWIVRGPSGNLLRRFVDTNGDNRIDQWCYYRGGIEVYRDIDGDFNEKADQYRWFGTEGMRWGLDQNEDGEIDDWKWISPEEVSAELLGAIRDKDPRRFSALLITPDELKQLKFQPEVASQINARTEKAKGKFAEFAARQKGIGNTTRWIDFSAPGPGVVPAGSQAERDLVVYENAMAMMETDGQHDELPVGTLLQIDSRWRLLDVPSDESNGFFFNAVANRAAAVAAGTPGVSPELQQLVQKLEELDKGLGETAANADIRRVHSQRCGLLRELVQATSGEDRDMWLLQLVDSCVAAAQNEDGTADTEILTKLVAEVETATQNKEIIGQAKFVALTADYSASLQQPKVDFAEIQSKWIENLEAFVERFRGTRSAAESMLQLATSQEFAGENEEAIKWYEQIVKEYPQSEMAEKATGATRRLQSIGKPFDLRGQGLDGRPIDTSSLRGNLVLIHYWATWCEPCKQDMKQLQQLLAQYGRQKFAVVGVNLDNDPKAALTHLRSERISWPQLHDSGGLDSSLAKQMGIFALPVMLLVDTDGTVANRAITIEELGAELKKRSTSSR